ncbi:MULTISPECIES: class I SAM-dependent methyltransferase [Anaerotruncus]|nr:MULTISPECIES: class I SAM-dependent methyltransferase [Anaerotruncus]
MFKEIEDAWTEDSNSYDRLVQTQLSNRRDVIHWSRELKQILGEEPLDVLDVGCGPGFLSIMLSRLGHRVKAIDGAEGMVDCAARNLKKESAEAVVEVEDAVELPVEAAESYDVIISRDVVWTLYDPEKAFVRWREVLKPGGKVIIYDGDYRRGEKSLKKSAWRLLSQAIILITERRIPEKATHSDDTGMFRKLPMVTAKQPEEDKALILKAGYKKIRITEDSYRNSFKRLEYWKYGYQGKKFRIIIWK